MKILAAFDSFKESMSAYRAGVAITQAAPDHEVTIIPMADGGEGTMDALQEALEGEIHALYVTGPNFKPVRAKLAICDDLAVIECAMACGLDLLKEAEKDGIHMTTRGVGEMIRYALSLGVKRVLITLGGSATNDGGIGMLSALGIKFYDASHEEVVPYGDSLDAIATIDCSAYCVPDDVEVIGVCDVSNPLLGKQGASYIFGPQKMVKDVALMDKKMASYARVTAETIGYDYAVYPGTGAAGGLGFAIISYMHGRLERGFEAVARLTGLEEAIINHDLIITGEGSMDHQTLFGKTPFGVMKVAKKHGKKVIGFAGKLEDEEVLLKAGFDGVYTINKTIKPLAIMLEEGYENLYQTAKEYFDENLSR